MDLYYRLLDSDFFGTIIKISGSDAFRFDTEKQEWRDTGMMILFYSDESDKYGLYEEISEKEAKEYVRRILSE